MDKREKTTIALISTSINERGGRCRHFANLYQHINKNEFKVIIFICSKFEEAIREFMLKNGVMPEDLIFLSRRNKLLVFPFIFEIRRNLLKSKAQIAHTFDMQSDIFGGIAAKLAGIRYLYAQFESKVIPENTSFIKRIFYILGNILVKDEFNKTIVVSEGLRKEVILKRYRDPSKVTIIHLGINIPDKYKGKAWAFDKLIQGRPLIGTIARLSSEKAIIRFVNTIPLILKQFPDASFAIIGNGPEGDKIRSRAEELGVYNRIAFKHWSYNVFEDLEKIDIFVMPSIREGFPNILLEAQVLARPIVASNIDGISELITDKYNGLLTDTSCAEKFAESIIYLCKNPQEAVLLGENGYKRIGSDFTIAREVGAFLSLYRGKARAG